jgi:hypothetical protein
MLTCVICQDTLGAGQDREALECGHVFHSECIRTFAETKQIPLKEACPMKCHRPTGPDVFVQTTDGPGTAAQTTGADDVRAMVTSALQAAASVI